MANSLAYEWALANQGGTETLYKNINDFLAGTQAGQTGAPTLEQTQAAMAQYGVSPEDIQAATGRSLESFYQPQFTSDVGPASPLSQVTSTPTQPIGALAAAAPAQEETISVTTPPSAGYAWATQDPQGVAAGGLQNYYSNINKWFSDPAHTQADTEAAMQQYGISEADIQAATGKTLDQIYAPPAPEQLANNPLLAQPYQKYKGTLTGGTMTPEVMQSLYGSVVPNFTKNVNNIASQILAQQAAGTDKYWYSGNTASNQNAAYDFAFRLAEKGITDLSDLGLRTGTQDLGVDEYGNPITAQYSELINKKTGQSLGYLGNGNQWDSSYNLDLDYKIGFTEDGKAIPYTSNQASAWADIREGFVKPVISMAAGPLGYGAELAAANALYAASQGDWDKAVLSAISASVPMAQSMGLDASTVGALQTAQKAATVLKTLQDKNLLGLATSGADLAGISSIAGLDVKDVTSAIKLGSAILNADKNPGGLVNAMISYAGSQRTADSGITNRVYDDTIVQAGANAFIKAKSLNASDEDAYAAANAAIDAAMMDLANAGQGATNDQGEFAGVDQAASAQKAANTVAIGNTEADTPQEAFALAKSRNPNAQYFTFGGQEYSISAQQSALDASVKADKLDQIKNLPNFNDAFAQARELLGPNQTFEWNGKQYSTATFAENPALSGNVVSGGASTTAGGGRGSYAGYDAAAATAATGNKAADTTTAAAEKTGFWGNLVDSISNQFKISSQEAEDYLKNNPNSPITKSVSAGMEAAGELIKNIGGGTSLMLENKPISDAFVKGGNELITLGQSVGTGPQDTKNWNDTLALLDSADGLKEKLGVIAGRIMDGTSGLARQTQVELKQELPALFLGGTSVKAGMIAAGLIDAGDTGGSVALEEFQKVIDKGGSLDQAFSAARKTGGTAAATELAVDLTLGKLGEFLVDKLGNVAAKGAGRVVGETLTEGAQEGLAAGATDFAAGRAVDVNNMLTNAVAGAAVGHSTSTSTAGISAAQDLNESTITSAVKDINSAVSTAAASGDANAVSSSIANSIKSGTDAGLDAGTVITATLGTALTNGADVNNSVNSVVSSTLTADGSNAQNVATDVMSAVNAVNGDVNAATNALQSSLVNSGIDPSTAANIVATAKSNASTTSLISGAGTSLASDAGATTGPSVTQSTAGTGVSTGATTGTGAVTGTGAGTGTGTTTGGNTTAGTGATTGTGASTGTTTGTGAITGTGVTTGTQTTAGTGTTTGAGVTTNTSVDANTGATTTTSTNANTNTQTTTQADANGNVTNQTTVNNNTGVTTNVSTDASTNTQTTTQTDANGNVTSQTSVNNNTGVTTQTTTNANSTTNTSVDANNGVNTQSTVDNKTGVTTNVTVDTKNNVSTQTVTDPNANTETTVRTDVNTNTQTTVVVNTQTGDIVDYIETTVPPTYTPPVIKVEDTTPPETTTTPTTPTAPSTTAATTAAPKTAPKGTSSADALMASIAASAPMGLSLTPQYLKSTVTGGAIDPLAAVKQAQQEMERDAIMQQIDPRLAQILMDRMGIQPQGGQMGAYGEASNEPTQNYYTYGQEDSIDDILGGKAANFKEGGYVAPLMATGGMALPLLAKSGGALSHYNGREDFKHGKHVAGEGDGQSDDIPAWLADGEFVVPSDVVSALGNGSSKAGTDKLYEMMHSVRERARSTGPKDLPPPAFKSPLDYMRKGNKK